MDRHSSNKKKISIGADDYISSYGYHFSKRLCEFAVSMMRKKDSSGNDYRIDPYSKEEVDRLLSTHKVDLKNNLGYDACYVANMCKADYYGSSITDERHLALFVKDYLDDIDGSTSRAFDEFIVKCIDQNIPLIWEDYM